MSMLGLNLFPVIKCAILDRSSGVVGCRDEIAGIYIPFPLRLQFGLVVETT